MGYTKLKQQVTELKESKDQLFLALEETGTAQAALYELWAQADLNCGPEDYDVIVAYYRNLYSLVTVQQPQATEKCLCCGKVVGGRCGACHCQVARIKHDTSESTLTEYGKETCNLDCQQPQATGPLREEDRVGSTTYIKKLRLRKQIQGSQEGG